MGSTEAAVRSFDDPTARLFGGRIITEERKKMPLAKIENDYSLYYEFTGPEDAPVILQFGGSLFGRANFAMVNVGFRENFRLLSFDALGYGESSRPIINHTIENWANTGAQLLDALGLEKVLVHGTSMGGMIAIAFAGLHPERTIATCADCGMLRPDVHRKTLFRNWRRSAECMSLDDFSDLVTIQAVGADFLEENPSTFDMVRSVINLNDPFTIKACCLAMENMDLEYLVPSIKTPILLTNGSRDIMTPPVLAPSGYSVADLAAARPDVCTLHDFPDIGHADLLEAPDQALKVVTDFFKKVLAAA